MATLLTVQGNKTLADLSEPTPLVIDELLDHFEKNKILKDLKEEEIPKVAFEEFLKYIVSKKWIYANSSNNDKRSRSVSLLPTKEGHIVNCYDLSHAFRVLLVNLKVDAKSIELVEYHQELSKPLEQQYQGVYGKFACFDETARNRFSDNDNYFRFDNHCVVKVGDWHYDPTFQCYYKNSDIFDHSEEALLIRAAAQNDLKTLKERLETFCVQKGNNINFQEPNFKFSLLHFAVNNANFEMIKLLDSYKIDPNLLDRKGLLAISYTKDYGILDYMRSSIGQEHAHLIPDLPKPKGYDEAQRQIEMKTLQEYLGNTALNQADASEATIKVTVESVGLSEDKANAEVAVLSLTPAPRLMFSYSESMAFPKRQRIENDGEMALSTAPKLSRCASAA